MKRKALISTIVSFLLLLAVVAAGLNAVYTITDVHAEFTTYSQEGKTEAEELREKLNAFVGKSSLFFNLSDAEATVEDYACFRADAVEKKYPSGISVTVTERTETFACANENGYSILDETGCYLYEKEVNVNRTGGANVLLDGFSFTLSYHEEIGGAYAEELLAVFDAFREALSLFRANVLSVTLVHLGSETTSANDYFIVSMREGVKIYLNNPSSQAAKKAAAAAETYLSLSDGERLTGSIVAADSAESGGVTASYTRTDLLA